MNSNELSESWEIQKFRVGDHWDRLTTADLDAIAGSREKFVVLLQKLYGLEASEAEVSLGIFLTILEKEQALDELLKAAEERSRKVRSGGTSRR